MNMNRSRNSDWKWDYIKKQNQEELKLIEEAMEGKVDSDVYNLKMILLSIKPYSKWWKEGYIKSLKRAIKLVEKDNKVRGKNND